MSMERGSPIQTYALWVGDVYGGPPKGPIWQSASTWLARHSGVVVVFFDPASGAEQRLAPLVAGLPHARVPFPDPVARLTGYRIEVCGEPSNALFVNLPCDAETGITHLFVYGGDERLVADMEIDDGANFLLLHLSQTDADELAGMLTDPALNAKVCTEWSPTIDGLAGEGESWSALGTTRFRRVPEHPQ